MTNTFSQLEESKKEVEIERNNYAYVETAKFENELF